MYLAKRFEDTVLVGLNEGFCTSLFKMFNINVMQCEYSIKCDPTLWFKK